MLFSDRGEKVSLGLFQGNWNPACKHLQHSKRIQVKTNDRMFQKTNYTRFGGNDPPARANLRFAYAQSGPKRSSFSGTTVNGCNLMNSMTELSKHLLKWVFTHDISNWTTVCGNMMVAVFGPSFIWWYSELLKCVCLLYSKWYVNIW